MFFGRRSASEVVLHECSMAFPLPQYYVFNRTIVENLAAAQQACPNDSSDGSLGFEGRWRHPKYGVVLDLGWQALEQPTQHLNRFARRHGQ